VAPIGLLDRITNLFNRKLPEMANAQRPSPTDTGLISKTSPSVWEYEMFRVEWDRRSVLRAVYQMMREDTRVKSANHRFAATAVRRGFDLKISSEVSKKEAAKAQAAIDDLRRRVSLDAKLSAWARVLLRDGDLFLNPIVDLSSNLIREIKSLPALTMQRNEDITGNFPDNRRAFQQIDPLSLEPLLELALWQVNHIRWDHEQGERYGRSQYLSMLAKWKQLDRAEKDLVIRRRTRAAMKRAHIIGTPQHPGSDPEVDAYMKRNKITGGPNEIVTDYFLNGLGDVKNLDGDGNLDHIKDIVYLQEVYMIATGVPLHLMGFGQNVNRDIVQEQMEQFQEDVQELRSLLENGDGSAYSGIRSLFDLQLALLEIDPSILEYNIRWYENDTDTANDRINRIIPLRAAQPDPLISRETALRVLSKDLGLDNDDAIQQEIERIKAEQSEAKTEQQTEAGQLNPEKPSQVPLGKPIAAATGKPAQDSVENTGPSEDLANVNLRATGNDISYPLHDDPQLDEMEQQIRQRVKEHFGMASERFLNRNRGRIARLADVQPSLAAGMDAVEYTMDSLTQALLHPGDCDCVITDAKKSSIAVNPLLTPLLQDWATESADSALDLARYLGNAYVKVGEIARQKVAAETDHPGVTLTVKDSAVQQLLKHEAAQRVTGIMQTTQKLLAQQLSEAFAGQESSVQWEARIQSVLDMPQWRAQMIAQTELANAYNRNLLLAYNEIGTQWVTWLAIVDSRTCPICSGRNGMTYPLNSVPTIPAHPNCRCTLVSANGPNG